MGAYRLLAGAAAAVLAAGLAGQALAQAAPPVPDDLARAVFDWGVCRGHVVDERFQGQETPAAIVEDAVTECRTDEAKVRGLATKYYGAAGPSTVDQLVAAARQGLMRMVDERRSGSAFSDPAMAWGRCVDQHVRAGAAGPDDPGAIVDHAFAACRDMEQKSLAKGDESPAGAAQMRDLERERAFRTIAGLRRQQH